MEFIVPESLEKTVHLLWSHAASIPVLADTVVVAEYGKWGWDGSFSVKRRWKGASGFLVYTMIEMNGQLTETADGETVVKARIRLGEVAILAALLALGLAIGGMNSTDGSILYLASIVIVLLFVIDAVVLYRIIRSLKQGSR